MLLFHVICLLLVLLVAGGLHLFVPSMPYDLRYLTGGSVLGSLLLTWLAGHASRGKALRKVVGSVTGQPQPDPPSGTPKSAAWYIESTAKVGELPQSCSFVEFDERGDYLDFHQHRHAYEKIRTLAESSAKLKLVIFIHGWRNGGHSSNVVSFNDFLHQIATDSVKEGEVHRVHGVYIAWRGGCLKHGLEQDAVYQQVKERYGNEDIVDLKHAARFTRFNEVLETFSYFDRKSVPEHKFSGTALSRTLVSCAHVAKRYQADSQVSLIGHSLGGLLLERTFQNATIGELTKEWPFGDSVRIKNADANPLPFDTVLLVNSAAPSIYAKQFQSYLAAHRQAMVRDNIVGANAPIFISLTSTGDWATGKIHRWANALSFLLPTLRRNYCGADFILATSPGSDAVRIPQSYYYGLTPGHNPLLVNRFIEPFSATTAANQDGVNDLFKFHTAPRNGGTRSDWTIQFPPQTKEYRDFSTYKSRLPVAWEQDKVTHQYLRKESAYWIVRLPPEIIAGHNDIWSQQAMNTYLALYRISKQLADQKTA